MAYINSEKVAQIRASLKKALPEYKFSVRKNSGNHGVTVSIMAGPKRFAAADHSQLNHYRIEWYENADVLEKIVDIANDGNHDNSEPQFDYFDVGWYIHLEQGRWNQPYVMQ
jgi:hypothetical protein